jgi:hypothetical protein
LTVRETFDFAFQCRTGGKHESLGMKSASNTSVPDGNTPESASTTGDLDAEAFTENLTIKGLDLSVCSETFVGNTSVRGVSGGQRRRVVSLSLKK